MNKREERVKADQELPQPKEGKCYLVDNEELINARVDQRFDSFEQKINDHNIYVVDELQKFGKLLRAVPNIQAELIILAALVLAFGGMMIAHLIR